MISTTLSALLSATATSLTVASASDFPGPSFRIAIEGETLIVTDGPPGSTTWTVQRDVLDQGAPLIWAERWDNEIASGEGWGKTSWIGDRSSSWDMSASGGVGIANQLVAGDTQRPLAAEAGQQLNAEVRFRFWLDALPDAGIEISPITRHQSPTSSYYRSRFRINSGATTDLRHIKTVSGSGSTNLGSQTSGPTMTAQEWWNLAVRASGSGTTTLEMKVWKDTDAEPGWQNTTTDTEATLQVAGYCGINFDGDALVTVLPEWLLDDFQISRIPTGVSHASGSTVVLVEEDWPLIIPVGHGAPSSAPASGAAYYDADGHKLYIREGAVWKSVNLT